MSVNSTLAKLDTFLGTHDYRANTLLYCNTLLLVNGVPFPPKAAAVRDWFNTMFLTAALTPDAVQFTPPPHPFDEVVAEVAAVLSA